MSVATGLLTSKLFDESTFYQTFTHDLEKCEYEVIIESPYVTCGRMRTFDRCFKKLLERGVKIYIITRDPREHTESLEVQSEAEIRHFEAIGVQVLISSGNHHRKLAILDRQVLWEGSLNIMSQNQSREIMRRIDSKKLTMDMFNFLKLEKFL